MEGRRRVRFRQPPVVASSSDEDSPPPARRRRLAAATRKPQPNDPVVGGGVYRFAGRPPLRRPEVGGIAAPTIPASVDFNRSIENLRSDSECPVCLLQYSEDSVQLTPMLMGKCSHVACRGCLRRLMEIPEGDVRLHRRPFFCPVCRALNSKADDLPFSMRRIVFGLVTTLKGYDAEGKKASLKCSRCNAMSAELVLCTGGCGFKNECVCFRCTVVHHPKCETKIVSLSEIRAKTVQILEEEAEKTRCRIINKLRNDMEGALKAVSEAVKKEASTITGSEEAEKVLQRGQVARQELEKQANKCIESFKADVNKISNP